MSRLSQPEHALRSRERQQRLVPVFPHRFVAQAADYVGHIGGRAVVGNVELAGGQFRASSTTGTMGTVLIDPETVTVSADYYSGGANHNIVADNTITVKSSRADPAPT